MTYDSVKLLANVAVYYTEKFNEHGETPRGVDWNGEESQQTRFDQLYKLLSCDDGFSLCDLGCGYGSFYDYLSNKDKKFSYYGVDLSEGTIEAAKRRYLKQNNVHFFVSNKPTREVDYSVASGIFNVQTAGNSEWELYLKDTLEQLNRFSRRGFAFNCLTTYSDLEKMQAHLYYANPTLLFDFCKKQYSKNVALLHDYGLYEFTILVRKIL